MDINAYKQVPLDQQKEKNAILLENLTARRENDINLYHNIEWSNRK